MAGSWNGLHKGLWYPVCVKVIINLHCFANKTRTVMWFLKHCNVYAGIHSSDCKNMAWKC